MFVRPRRDPPGTLEATVGSSSQAQRPRFPTISELGPSSHRTPSAIAGRAGAACVVLLRPDMLAPVASGANQPIPPDLEDLASRINPERTILLLGAGASIPSGAPSGSALAREISLAIAGKVVSDDLMDASTLLEARYGRSAVVEAVRAQLTPLKPSGGLIALAEQPWHAIYTTNFDRLVELAYSRAGRRITPIRSNFDYGKLAASDATPLFKLHGCVTQDAVDGHQGRLVLTENDYDEYESYRQALFQRFALDTLSMDVLVLGQSLRDKHLRDQLKLAHELHEQQGVPGGRLFALVYESDADRLDVQRRRGFIAAAGSLDQLVYALTRANPPTHTTDSSGAPADDQRLRMKPLLRVAAIDVDQGVAQQPDVVRMFNGRPATYADVRAGFTFERSPYRRLMSMLEGETQFLSVIGSAGVGKTTLARQILVAAHATGAYCWEHAPDFPLDADAWLYVEEQLEARGASGFLLIDDCTRFLGSVNQLAHALAAKGPIHLRLVLTAAPSQWRPRLKSRHLFGPRAATEDLSLLTDEEIDNLVNLAANVGEVRGLVERGFALLSRSDQTRQLRMRARADMFVCLKNVFATEELDNILLREFADVDDDKQIVYQTVAGIQAIGGRAHRQLALRLLDLRGDQVSDALDGLAGIVDEITVSASEGIYVWETRHPVIAEIVTRYKYSTSAELAGLLERIIENSNPAVRMELVALKEMCNADYGIRSLPDKRQQLALYRQLVEAVPGERIPRHRLIGTLLDLNDIDAASQEIRRALEVVGLDRPLNRYQVRLQLARARTTPGIRPEDREAIVRQAERHALLGIEKYPDDKFTYIAYVDVGFAMAETTGDTTILDLAIDEMSSAVESDVPDPALRDALDGARKRRDRLGRTVDSGVAPYEEIESLD